MLVNHKAMQSEKKSPTMIYLDNWSTYNQMYNEDLLTDVREGKIWMFVHFNAGTTSTKKRDVLVLLSVGSPRKWLIWSSSSKNWGNGVWHHVWHPGRALHCPYQGWEGPIQQGWNGYTKHLWKKYQDMAFVQTVRKLFGGVTKKEINVDKLAFKSQRMIFHPY